LLFSYLTIGRHHDSITDKSAKTLMSQNTLNLTRLK